MFFNETGRLMSSLPLAHPGPSKLIIYDTRYLKHISTIDFNVPLSIDNYHSRKYCVSFNGDYVYICVNGLIQVWNWCVNVHVGDVQPALNDNWRIYPVYDGKYLAALDIEMLYLFDVSAPAVPILHRVFVADDLIPGIGGGAGDMPPDMFPWTNAHLANGMLIAHRSLLAHPNPAFFGHALYFWSLADSSLKRIVISNQSEFPKASLMDFIGSEMRFFGNSALLIDRSTCPSILYK